MGDCNLGQCKTYKNEEKFCKYSYSSWCPTCERNSPRRRSRSETNEPCKRKVKDMKTQTPKRYNYKEYENMDCEYDTWQDKDIRYDCCRIRSNLCELPTSYITNNHQISVNTPNHIGSNDTGDLDCLKSVTYESTLKFVDFSDQLENLGNMQEKSKFDTKLSPTWVDHSKLWKKADLKSTSWVGYPSKSPVRNLSYLQKELYKDSPVDFKRNSKSPELPKNSCREHCPFVDFKYHDLSNQRTVCYDTSTFFDRRNDISNLSYKSEVEYLRERLKTLHNSKFPYTNNERNQNISLNSYELCDKNNTEDMNSVTINAIDIKPSVKKEKPAGNLPLVKGKNRVSVKTKSRPNSRKSKRSAKSKSLSAASTNNTESVQLGKLRNKQDYSKFDTKLSSRKIHKKFWKKTDLKSTTWVGYPSPSSNPMRNLSYLKQDLYKDLTRHSKNPEFENCRENCPILNFKYGSTSPKTVCDDSNSTFFERRSYMNHSYKSDIEYLKERLKMLYERRRFYSNIEKNKNRKSFLKKNTNEIGTITDLCINMNPQDITKKPVVDALCVTKNVAKKRITVKTKSRPTSKRLGRSVLTKPASVLCNEDAGGDSGSDSEDEVNLDDEVDNVSEPSTDDSNKDAAEVPLLLGHGSGSGDASLWPIRQSMFPNIPPYIRFNSHDAQVEFRIPNGRKFLKWKLSTITPIIIRKTLTNSGFALVRKSNQWLGTWGKHMKSPMFKTLKESQKLNHFPGTFQLGRKDRLWRNFQRMIHKYGYREFGFLPHSYILPQELKLLKQSWDFQNCCGREMWIIKPPASARGVGIKVINKWSQLPKKTSLVVQKYISNPYLINGSKFDLRLYVMVTSFHPLRVYLYPDGLARFASAKYSEDVKDLKDRYMHLTNYSINKQSAHYTANEDAFACQGHKWTISKLLEYLENDGVDTKFLWRNLQQLVVKTCIACEPPITQLCEENMNNTYNCYELFGVDVLLDENLKPWLLEVNISPSLHSASPLDAHVKGPLVQTLFDMAQFHLPTRLGQSFGTPSQCFDARFYTTCLTKKEKNKHATFTQMERREDYLNNILLDLTGDDVRQLVRAEDEYAVKGKFERIFPNCQSHKYLNFMEPRYYNRLFDAWEAKYGQSREEGISKLKSLCTERVHLKSIPQSAITKCSPIVTPLDTSIQPSKEGRSHQITKEEELVTNKASMLN